jgi:hypothetical protein
MPVLGIHGLLFETIVLGTIDTQLALVRNPKYKIPQTEVSRAPKGPVKVRFPWNQVKVQSGKLHVTLALFDHLDSVFEPSSLVVDRRCWGRLECLRSSSNDTRKL